MAARDKKGEPRILSLLVSVLLHGLAGLGVAASTWWWGPPALETWKTQTVALVDAPLSLQAATALPQAPPPPKVTEPKPEAPKLPPPPKVAEPKPEPPKVKEQKPEPPKAPPPPKATAKKPEPPKVAEKKPAPPKAPPPPKIAEKKPEPPKKPPKVEKKPEPKAASSREARSSIEALRKRQVKRAKEEQKAKERQAETEQRRTASARVAALRSQLAQQESVGGSAVTAVGVQRVRLMAYQQSLRDKIIETWILPLSAEQRRNLQATAQFQVMRNGDVMQLELVKPSGNALFDASLLRAIRRASPLPSLPDDYALDSLEVVMRFRADA